MSRLSVTTRTSLSSRPALNSSILMFMRAATSGGVDALGMGISTICDKGRTTAGKGREMSGQSVRKEGGGRQSATADP